MDDQEIQRVINIKFSPMQMEQLTNLIVGSLKNIFLETKKIFPQSENDIELENIIYFCVMRSFVRTLKDQAKQLGYWSILEQFEEGLEDE